jgi:hypothetical protein
MTTPNDYRALCSEVIFVWSRSTNPDDLHENMIPLVDRARALLAQPEPEGVTDEGRELQWPPSVAVGCHEAAVEAEPGSPLQQLLIAAGDLLESRWCRPTVQPEPEGVSPDHVNLIAFAYSKEPWATWLKPGGCLESAHCEMSELLLAAITRYARPTIQPVPVAERPWEREGWCDAEGRCWLYRPAEIPCRLANATLRRWVLDTPNRDEEPVHDSHSLPHNALPVPQNNS